MSKAKFAAARELIGDKRYDEARLLLETVDHPKAAEWILRIDAIMAQEKITKTVTSKPKPQVHIVKGSNGGGCFRLAIYVIAGVVLLSCLAGIGIIVIGAYVVNDAIATLEVDLGNVGPGEGVEPDETVPTTHNFEGFSDIIIGPVRFQNGRHRAIVKSTDFSISVNVHAVAGRCDDGVLGLFWLEESAPLGAEALMTTMNCEALIEVTGLGEQWTLTFELIQ